MMMMMRRHSGRPCSTWASLHDNAATDSSFRTRWSDALHKRSLRLPGPQGQRTDPLTGDLFREVVSRGSTVACRWVPGHNVHLCKT